MKTQLVYCVATLADLSSALTLGRPAKKIERRQNVVSEGASSSAMVDALSSMANSLLGGSQSVSGLLSGYSIASMAVTALNCKLKVDC
jgi:hypothetical protein